MDVIGHKVKLTFDEQDVMVVDILTIPSPHTVPFPRHQIPEGTLSIIRLPRFKSVDGGYALTVRGRKSS
jgi:hypothetical protein